MRYKGLLWKAQEFSDQLIEAVRRGKISSYVLFAVNVKSIKILKVILESIDKETLKIAKEKISEQNPTDKVVNDETVSSVKKRCFDTYFKEAFTTKVQHRVVYRRTPLEICVYHYNQCSDYQSKSEGDKKVTNDVEEVFHSALPDDKDFWDYTKDEDFKKAKEFIETILNSARDNGILEDVLIASGIRKELAKELSDSNKEQSNDVIINRLQQNQKAEEKGTRTGLLIGLAGLILAIILASWIIAGAAVLISIVIGRSVYTSNQPSTIVLETHANQKVGSEIAAGS